MQKKNRDLIVLLNEHRLTPWQLESQVMQLHEILYTVETTQHLSRVHEVVDINNYKVIRNQMIVKSFLRNQISRPFVFLLNRN